MVARLVQNCKRTETTIQVSCTLITLKNKGEIIWHFLAQRQFLKKDSKIVTDEKNEREFSSRTSHQSLNTQKGAQTSPSSCQTGARTRRRRGACTRPPWHRWARTQHTRGMHAAPVAQTGGMHAAPVAQTGARTRRRQGACTRPLWQTGGTHVAPAAPLMLMGRPRGGQYGTGTCRDVLLHRLI